MDSYDEEDKSPFDDLFLWAILTKKFELASLMWQRGRQSIAKALIGSRLCFKMSEIARAKYNTDAADLILVECRFVFSFRLKKYDKHIEPTRLNLGFAVQKILDEQRRMCHKDALR